MVLTKPLRRKKIGHRKTGSSKSTAAKATLALKIARSLEREVELKSHTFTTSHPMIIVPGIIPLTQIARGDGNVQRIGNKIRGVNVEYRWQTNWGTSTVSQNALLRVILLRDTQQPADTVPSATDIFGSTLANVQDMFSVHTVPSRFKIMYDRIQSVGNTTSIPTDPPTALFLSAGPGSVFSKFKFKFDYDVLYNGSLLTDIQKNGLYLVLLSSLGAGGPVHTGEGRFTYTG